VFAVVNHPRFKAPVTQTTIEQFQNDAIPRMRAGGCAGTHVVQVDERHLVLVIFFESRESLDQLTESIGSGFMKEHVVSLLDQATERSVGEVVASSHRA
jgi:hypothetical protein